MLHHPHTTPRSVIVSESRTTVPRGPNARTFSPLTWRSVQTAAAVALGLVLSAGEATAQAPREYQIPSDKLNCLVDNQEKYLNLPRAIILLSPETCPAIGNEEVAGLALNSAVDEQRIERLLMTKADFSCLVTKIDTYLKGDEAEPPATSERIAFVLDCE